MMKTRKLLGQKPKRKHPNYEAFPESPEQAKQRTEEQREQRLQERLDHDKAKHRQYENDLKWFTKIEIPEIEAQAKHDEHSRYKQCTIVRKHIKSELDYQRTELDNQNKIRRKAISELDKLEKQYIAKKPFKAIGWMEEDKEIAAMLNKHKNFCLVYGAIQDMVMTYRASKKISDEYSIGKHRRKGDNYYHILVEIDMKELQKVTGLSQRQLKTMIISFKQTPLLQLLRKLKRRGSHGLTIFSAGYWLERYDEYGNMFRPKKMFWINDKTIRKQVRPSLRNFGQAE